MSTWVEAQEAKQEIVDSIARFKAKARQLAAKKTAAGKGAKAAKAAKAATRHRAAKA